MADLPTLTGLVLRVRGDDVPGVQGDPVASWPDTAAVTAYAQTNAAKYPVLSVASLNGHDGVQFDGVDDALTAEPAVRGALRNRAGATIITVHRYAATPTGTTNVAAWANGTSETSIRSAVQRSGTAYRIGGRRLDADSFQSTTQTTGVTDDTGVARVVTAVYDWANASVYEYRDGTQVISNTAFQTAGSTSDTDSIAAALGSAPTRIGDFLNGTIYEVIVYSRVLTADERAQVHTYVQDQYGITVSDYQAPPAQAAEPAITQTATRQLAKPGGTSLAVPYGSPVTEGTLLRTTLGVDKHSGTINAPTDNTGTPWTLAAFYIEASVSGAVAYKVATGAETTVTWTWTTTQTAAATVLATNITGAAPMTGAAAATAVNASGVTSVSLPGVTATGNALAFATASVDSGYPSAWTATDPVWSGGYATAVAERGDASGSATSNGGACSAVGWKAVVSGDPTAFTASWTGADQACGFLDVYTYTGVSGAAVASQAITTLWPGGLTSSSLDVAVEATAGASVRVAYSTSPTLASPSYTPAVTADARGVAKVALTGLAGATKYHAVVQIGGVATSNGAFSFTTGPAVYGSYRITVGSCRQHGVASQPVFDRIRNLSPLPLFHILHGDRGYEDHNTTDPAPYRTAWNDYTRQANVAAQHRVVPSDNLWSDHDFCSNGSHAGSTGKATVQSVFRERVPDSTLRNSSGGIERTKVIGRVRYVYLDTRSYRSAPGNTDNSSKTMLGSDEESWFVNLMNTATEPAVVIVCDVPWIPGGNQDDHWGSYRTAQNRIVAAVNAAAWAKAIWVCGDAHMLGWDSGQNSPGGSPVWQAAALSDRTGSTKGGPYSGGTLQGSGQFGIIDVTDTGGDIVTLTFTGVRSTGATWSTHTVSLPATPVPAGGGGGGGETPSGLFVWNGTTKVPATFRGVWDGTTTVPVQGHSTT